jgi:hypothetical protein
MMRKWFLKFWLSLLKRKLNRVTRTNSEDCSESRIRISVPASRLLIFFTKRKAKIVKTISAPAKSRTDLIYRTLKKDIYLLIPLSDTSFFFFPVK